MPLTVDRKPQASAELSRISTRWMMMAGSGSIFGAIVLSFFMSGEGVGFLGSVFFLLFCVAVILAEFQSGELVDAVPALFAACALIPGLWLLRPSVTSILWLAGTAFVSYAAYLRIQGGSALSGWITPEMAWSGSGSLVSIGASICNIALYLKWGNAGYQYTDEHDKIISLGWFSGHETQFGFYVLCALVLWVVRCVVRRNPMHLLDVFSFATLLLVVTWWIWMIRINHFLGQVVFGLGLLTAAVGLIATARRHSV